MQAQKLKRVVVKEEFVALTGDVTKAIILNQFIYWSERVSDFDKFILEEKSRAEQEGETINIELRNGWIYKTAEELAEETMLGLAPSSMRKHIKELVEKDWLSQRNNPQYKWDRTLQYRVNINKICSDLLGAGYILQEYKIDIAFFISKAPISKIENGAFDLENHIANSEDQGEQNSKAIPEITTEITKLLVSKDTNNEELAFQASSSVVGLDQKTSNKKHDSHSQTSMADTAINSPDKNQGGSVPINQPTAKELIAELVKEYRALEDIKPQKGDYSFIGGLYDKYGYNAIYVAIDELSMAMAAGEIRRPLLYLRGILANLGNENNTEHSDSRLNKSTGGGKREYSQPKSKSRSAGEGNSKSGKYDQDQKGQRADGSFCTTPFPEGFDVDAFYKDPHGYYDQFYSKNRQRDECS